MNQRDDAHDERNPDRDADACDERAYPAWGGGARGGFRSQPECGRDAAAPVGFDLQLVFGREFRHRLIRLPLNRGRVPA